MEKYKKGKNVEEPLTEENIPIKNLPKDFLWMKVQGGTKIHNVLGYALGHMHGCVLWTGCGPAAKKAISCAELTKQRLGHRLHQITKLCWRTCDEHWEPLVPGLDELVVRRRVPVVHVLLSEAPLDSSEPGYQPPGKETPFRKEIAALAEKNKSQSATPRNSRPHR